MTQLFEPFLCSHFPVPTSGDLFFTIEEAEEALNAFLALWDPDVLGRSSCLPRWCRPDEIPSLEGDGNSPILVVWCDGAIPPSAAPDYSLRLPANPVGSIHVRIRSALELQEKPTISGNDPSHFYPSIGLGVLLIDALFDSQNHSNLLQREQVWASLQSALRARSQGDSTQEMDALREAANYLVVARESLSSSNGHLVDFTELSAGGNKLPESSARAAGFPRVIAASGLDLIGIATTHPQSVEALRKEIEAGETEMIGGCYVDRPESGLAMSSILWNLECGQRVLSELFGKPARIHYRKHALPAPSFPAILRHFGLVHQVLPFERENGVFPSSRASIVSWSWGDAMGLESFAGTPLETGSSKDLLHVARRFSESISTDYTPVLFFRNNKDSPCQAYGAFCKLSSLAPVFGKFTDMDSLFRSVSAGDYWNESSGTEFGGKLPRHEASYGLNRNWLDTSMAIESLLFSLGTHSLTPFDQSEIEKRIEAGTYQGTVKELALESGTRLAERILRTGESNHPGFLLLNPNAFNRRVIVELMGSDCLPIQAPVLASEPGSNGSARAVVEIPGLGFAWIPKCGVKGTQPPRQRWHLADERGVRNEFAEAEFDPATGSLRGLRDLRNRIPRIQQSIQIGKGGSMLAKSTKVLSRGPARGELAVEGIFVDGQGQQIGQFTQTMRAWIGRPLIELEIEVCTQLAPAESPPSLRFFWKDQSTEVRIGSLGQSIRLTGERLTSAEYVHLLQGANATTIVGQGPLSVQRKGNRSIELFFDSADNNRFNVSLGFAVDRDYPHLLAKGWQSPFLVIPVEKGPPSSGTNGWLIHLDSPGVNLERFRVNQENEIEATLVECLDEPVTVGINFAKPPRLATQSDDRAESSREITLDNGTASFDMRRRGITSINLKPSS